jgi:hypothetical protein
MLGPIHNVNVAKRSNVQWGVKYKGTGFKSGKAPACRSEPGPPRSRPREEATCGPPEDKRAENELFLGNHVSRSQLLADACIVASHPIAPSIAAKRRVTFGQPCR